MSFHDDLKRFAAKADERQTLVWRKTALELFRRVIMRTPVDTGRLRGNWQCSSGDMASGEIDRLSPDGSGAVSEAVSVTLGADPAQPLYLTNNLPYARRIEYDGHSRQAPAGMVRVSVAEFRGIVEKVAAE